MLRSRVCLRAFHRPLRLLRLHWREKFPSSLARKREVRQTQTTFSSQVRDRQQHEISVVSNGKPNARRALSQSSQHTGMASLPNRESPMSLARSLPTLLRQTLPNSQLTVPAHNSPALVSLSFGSSHCIFICCRLHVMVFVCSHSHLHILVCSRHSHHRTVFSFAVACMAWFSFALALAITCIFSFALGARIFSLPVSRTYHAVLHPVGLYIIALYPTTILYVRTLDQLHRFVSYHRPRCTTSSHVLSICNKS
ncbi:uncharacterized protein F5147DRAFT_236516 [Suillus discolor]|uniref:Uncharacterized protein n=1 Tax=Suillus discolor TaxID=1912936 RepID=A0A9P7F4X2_9AGAM|nr:uncharacterized protein F5147DRAFT_236516 [Suillus discolor]KAG2105759.1 hypothetical protein F5147DRAFT_236516 [Suillus discolor]